MKIKNRYFIRKSEIKPLKDEILKQYEQKFVDQIFPAKCNVEVIETEAGDILFAINNVLKLWKSKEGYLPVLTLLIKNQVIPANTTYGGVPAGDLCKKKMKKGGLSCSVN